MATASPSPAWEMLCQILVKNLVQYAPEAFAQSCASSLDSLVAWQAWVEHARAPDNAVLKNASATRPPGAEPLVLTGWHASSSQPFRLSLLTPEAVALPLLHDASESPGSEGLAAWVKQADPNRPAAELETVGGERWTATFGQWQALMVCLKTYRHHLLERDYTGMVADLALRESWWLGPALPAVELEGLRPWLAIAPLSVAVMWTARAASPAGGLQAVPETLIADLTARFAQDSTPNAARQADWEVLLANHRSRALEQRLSASPALSRPRI